MNMRRIFILILFLFLPVSLVVYADQASSDDQSQSWMAKKTDLDFKDFDFDFKGDELNDGLNDSELDELLNLKPKTEVKAPDPKKTEVKPTFTMPLFGEVKLIPFKDSAGKKGFRAKLADENRKVHFGALTIDDAEILVIDNKLGVTGRATVLGKRARFGLKELLFTDGKSVTNVEKVDETIARDRVVKKAVFGFAFENQFSLDVIPGKSVRLTDLDLIVEFAKPRKPVILQGTTDLFGKKIEIGLFLSRSRMGAYLQIPEGTPLKEVLGAVKNTQLANAKIKQARLAVNAIGVMSSGAQKKVPEFSIDGKVDLSSVPFVASKGLAPAAQQPKLLSFNATMSQSGLKGAIEAPELTVKGFGKINNVKFIIDTTGRKHKVSLVGKSTLSITGVGDVIFTIDSELANDGIRFAGTIGSPVSYAGFGIENVSLGYDSEKRSAVIKGVVKLLGLPFDVALTFDPDAKDDDQRSVTFTTTTKAKEFTPFSTIPGLDSFKITDLSAGIVVDRVKGQIVKEVEFQGKTHIFGVPLSSIVRAVENSDGQKGIFVDVPVLTDKRIGDLIPALKSTPINDIQFKKFSFQLSTIDFRDVKTGAIIKQGLSVLAEVPLIGGLEKVAKILGSKQQTFTLVGSIEPDNIADSRFGIVLSKGSPDKTKVISLNSITASLGAKGTFDFSTEVTIRPSPKKKPNEEYLFDGRLQFEPASVEFKVAMDGMIKNIFDSGFSIKDPALEFGVMIEQPEIPTRIGGTMEFLWKNIAFKGAGVIDWADVNPSFAIEASVDPQDSKKKIRSVDFFDLMIQGFTLGQLPKGWSLDDLKIFNLLPSIDFYELYGRFNPTLWAAKVGNKSIAPGVAFKTKMDIFGKMGELDFYFGCGRDCQKVDKYGVKLFGTIQSFTIAEVLSVTGKKEKSDPTIDIELTPDRQNFLIDGRLTLGVPIENGKRFELFNTESYIRLSKNKIEIDLKSSIGGKDFQYKGNDLLAGKFHLWSEDKINKKNPIFKIDIEFDNYIAEYLKDKIDDGLSTAKKEVEKELTNAQKEVEKIDATIAQYHKVVQDARNAVERARKDLNKMKRTSQEIDATMAATKADWDKYNNWQKLKKKYDSYPDWQKALNPVAWDLGIRIASNQFSGAIVGATLYASKEVAKGFVDSARFMSQDATNVAQGVLQAAEGIGVGTLVMAKESSKGILEGVKQLSFVTLDGTKFVIDELDILSNFNINKFKYSSDDLSKMGDGVLGDVLIEGKLIEPFSWKIDLDFRKGPEFIFTAFGKLIEHLVQAPFKKIDRIFSSHKKVDVTKTEQEIERVREQLKAVNVLLDANAKKIAEAQQKAAQ